MPPWLSPSLTAADPEAVREAVLLNAGAALYICGITRNIGDGYLRARQALESRRSAKHSCADQGRIHGGGQDGQGQRRMTIVEKIVTRRKERVAREGHWLGARARDARDVPLESFGRDPFLVCEVKRRSPSREDIAPDVDVVEQARAYARGACAASPS